MSSTSTISLPDAGSPARALTVLGLTRLRQGGRLNVRQRELLRRALAKAGEARGWAAHAASSEDPVKDLRRDVERVLQTDSESMRGELAATMAAKQVEISELEDVAATARRLSEGDEDAYPTEITYSHTLRDATRGLVTHTETRTLSDPSEAESLAGTLDKSLSRWGRLREQMLLELEEEQRLLNQLSGDPSGFIDSLEDLVEDVLVTLR